MGLRVGAAVRLYQLFSHIHGGPSHLVHTSGPVPQQAYTHSSGTSHLVFSPPWISSYNRLNTPITGLSVFEKSGPGLIIQGSGISASQEVENFLQ